jgi:prepilin-type N-terminal cleavage/methylation domain-containing protein
MMLPTVDRRRTATRRAAFTLLEVLVVVAILVILAGVASISIFKYMDNAKVGRAKADMNTLVKAYQTYYTQHSEWPTQPAEVAPLLDQGINAFQSPWPGVTYQVSIQQQQQTDGTMIERPVAMCQPPGLPQIIVPDVNQGR